MATQNSPGTVAVPDSCTVLPATAVTRSIGEQLPRLGNPMPRPTAAAGSTLSSVTCTAPTAFTLKVCVLAPATSSVSLNVSGIVAGTGVGLDGGVGSEQPAASTAAARTAQSIRFICP